MLEVLMSVVLALVFMAGMVAIGIWVVKVCDSCQHSYERVDDSNDKKMILVCRKCGKIKQLKK